jgi:Nitrile hydratase beta subunit
MNGVHDMGGMHGFGPVEPEANEPVFHHRWEARTRAITKALGSWGKWNPDYGRHQRELIAPAEYLRMSYYEKWLTALAGQIVKVGLVTREELESGQPAPGTSKVTPPLTVEGVHEAIFGTRPFTRDVQVAVRFSIRPGTHAYPATRGITWASSDATMGCTCSPTPTPTSKVNIPNISIPCVSRRRSCGATRPRPGRPSTLTCGRAILTARDVKQSAPAVRPSLRDPGFARAAPGRRRARVRRAVAGTSLCSGD